MTGSNGEDGSDRGARPGDGDGPESGTGVSAAERDSLVRTLVKSGTLLAVGFALELGISFLAKLVIAQTLEPVQYGAVTVGVTTLGITSTVVLLGLSRGVGRYVPRYDDPAERRGVFVSAFQLAMPLAVGAGLAIVLGADVLARDVFSDPSAAPVLRVFGLAVPLAALVNLTVGSAQGLKSSTPKLVLRNLTLPVVRFAGIAVVVVLGARTVDIAWAYLASYVVAGVLAVYYLLRYTPLPARTTGYVAKHRELLRFSLPLVVSAAMVHVFSDLDTLMLGWLGDLAAVGVYGVVYPLAELVTVALAAFRFVFMPIISELEAASADAEIRRVYQVISKWVTMATVPAFLVMLLFPRLVINLTFGAKYNDGALALSVLSVGFIVHAVAGLNTEALVSIGRTRDVMYANVVTAALNLVLNLLLIPRYSFLGAAVATTLSYLALNLLASGQLYRLTGVHPFSEALVRPVAVGVPLVAVVTLLGRRFLVLTPATLLGLGVAFVLVYGLAILRFGGIEEEEVMLVLSFEERFGVDLGPFKTVANRLIR